MDAHKTHHPEVHGAEQDRSAQGGLAQTHAPDVMETKLPSEVKVVLSVLVVAATIMILNETVLSVALPSIMADFDVPASTAQWLTTGFMLTMAVVIPTSGFLLKRFTTRQIFITALTSFLIGTAVAAWAPIFGILLAGRVIQAVGTALVMPLLMTVAMTLVPAQRRGSVMGIISIVISVAPAVGPTVSGFILNSLTWHWIFLVMLPLVAIPLIVGILMVRNVGETKVMRVDVLSVILSAFAFGGLIYALSSMTDIINGEGGDALIVLVVGVACLVAFGLRQISLGKQDRALMDFGPFKYRNFTFAMVVMLVSFGTMLGMVTVLPIYLQTSLGVTALITGLIVMPGGVLQGIMAPFVGRLFDSVGPRPLLVPGVVIMISAVWWMTFLDENSPVGLLVAMHVTFSIGMALMMTPLMTTALGSLPTELYGHGSAILNTLQQLAGAAGTAMLIATFTFGVARATEAGETIEVATANGTHFAFILAGILVLAALVFAPLVRRVDTSK